MGDVTMDSSLHHYSVENTVTMPTPPFYVGSREDRTLKKEP